MQDTQRRFSWIGGFSSRQPKKETDQWQKQLSLTPAFPGSSEATQKAEVSGIGDALAVRLDPTPTRPRSYSRLRCRKAVTTILQQDIARLVYMRADTAPFYISKPCIPWRWRHRHTERFYAQHTQGTGTCVIAVLFLAARSLNRDAFTQHRKRDQCHHAAGMHSMQQTHPSQQQTQSTTLLEGMPATRNPVCRKETACLLGKKTRCTLFGQSLAASAATQVRNQGSNRSRHSRETQGERCFGLERWLRFSTECV